MEENTMSPTKEQTKAISGKTIKFPEAISEIIKGNKVHKLEWVDKEYYGFLNGEFLSLHKKDGKNYRWIIRDCDLSGDDYIVI